MTFARLATSQSKLVIDWKKKLARGEEQLSASAAVDQIAGRDDRPLLILREVTEPEADGRDEKIEGLLEATLKSERIQLAAPWFYCVTVPEQAANPEHPWSSLFDERCPERLVLITRDGKDRIGLLGTTRQRASWTAFASVLRREYKRDATSAAKDLNQLLARYDAIDGRKQEVEGLLTRYRKDNDRRKIQKYEKQLAELDADMKQAQAEEARLRDLVLRRRAQPEEGSH